MKNSIDSFNLEKVVTVATFNADFAVSCGGDFMPAPIISDKMVLQRNAVNYLWGKANFNGDFAVKIGEVINYGTAKGGKFEVYLQPMKENSIGQELIFINKKSKFVINDVLIGEVILCSGQSNMAWTLKQTMQDQGLHGGTEYPYTGGKYIPKQGEPFYEDWVCDSQNRQSMIKDYTYPSLISENKRLRFFKIDSEDTSAISQDEFKGAREPRESDDSKIRYLGWRESNSENNGYCSAIAFYFGLELSKLANLPIAVVVVALCGTLVSSWTPEEDYNNNKNVFRYGGDDAMKEPNNAQNMTGRCYNMFLAPIKNYRYKAVLWYQGETQDVDWAESMRVMILAWRRELNAPKLPFLVYQIARTGMFDIVPEGYGSKGNEEPTLSITYFNCREQQKKLCKLVSNCDYIINLDVGDYDEIHYYCKKLPGLRGAQKFTQALYGEKKTSYPEAIESSRKGESVLVTFANVGNGLKIINNGRNFETSADGVTYFNASAKVVSPSQIEVSCEACSINFIRYGALNYPKVTRHNVSEYLSLFADNGYPANQFLIEVGKSV